MERYDREGKRDFWLENVPRIAVIYISRPTNRLSIRRKEIKAAVVTDFGQAPAYGDFREPSRVKEKRLCGFAPRR